MQELLANDTRIGTDAMGRAVYRLETATGFLLVKPCAHMYMVQEHDRGSFVQNILWSLVNDDALQILLSNKIEFYVASSRQYGQPRLKKPKELKGIKPAFSANWLGRCNCPCFIQGHSVWVKHRDYFSITFRPPTEDIGKPTSYLLEKYFAKSTKQRFVYPDTWGGIVLRNEAWLKIEGLLPLAKHKPLSVLCHAVMQSFACKTGNPSLENDPEWEHFFTDVLEQTIAQTDSPKGNST